MAKQRNGYVYADSDGNWFCRFDYTDAGNKRKPSGAKLTARARRRGYSPGYSEILSNAGRMVWTAIE